MVLTVGWLFCILYRSWLPAAFWGCGQETLSRVRRKGKKTPRAMTPFVLWARSLVWLWAVNGTWQRLGAEGKGLKKQQEATVEKQLMDRAVGRRESAPCFWVCFWFAHAGFLNPLCQQPREQPWQPLPGGSISWAGGRLLSLHGSFQRCLHVTESFPPLPLITYHVPDCFPDFSHGLLFLTKGCSFSLQIPPLEWYLEWRV